MPKETRRIRRSQAALLVLDIQERLLPAMFEPERLVQNALRLIRGARVLGLPVHVTEQYPRGLGSTVSDIAGAFSQFAPFEKVSFSAWGAPGLVSALTAKADTEVILCGIETHVCVCQTCLDLLDGGSRVFVVADAVSSRTAENQRLGLDRMREVGATVVSTEMVLFELLRSAGTEEFKQILAVVK
jgi:nicotinamidase-related amidase